MTWYPRNRQTRGSHVPNVPPPSHGQTVSSPWPGPESVPHAAQKPDGKTARHGDVLLEAKHDLLGPWRVYEMPKRMLKSVLRLMI